MHDGMAGTHMGRSKQLARSSRRPGWRSWTKGRKVQSRERQARERCGQHALGRKHALSSPRALRNTDLLSVSLVPGAQGAAFVLEFKRHVLTKTKHRNSPPDLEEPRQTQPMQTPRPTSASFPRHAADHTVWQRRTIAYPRRQYKAHYRVSTKLEGSTKVQMSSVRISKFVSSISVKSMSLVVARQGPVIQCYAWRRHEITRGHPSPLRIEQHAQGSLSSWQTDDKYGNTRVFLVSSRRRWVAVKARGRPSRELCSRGRVQHRDLHSLPIQSQRGGCAVSADCGIGMHSPLDSSRSVNLVLQENLPPCVE